MEIVRIKLKNIYIFLFYIFVATYSLSSPFPKNIRIVEIIYGFLWLILIFPFMVKFFIYFETSKRSKILTILNFHSVFLLFSGLFLSLKYQWDAIDIVRDFIPFIYFVFPLIFLAVAKEKELIFAVKHLPIAICIIGTIFTIKAFYEYSKYGSLLLIGAQHFYTQSRYCQAPTVFFTGFFLTLMAINLLWRKLNFKNFFLLILFFLTGILSFLQVAASYVRFFIVSYFVIIIIFIIRKSFSILRSTKILKLKYFLLFGVVVSLLILSTEFAALFMEKVVEKTLTVGASGKGKELLYSINYVEINLFTTFIGTGWGTIWENPIYGGALKVSYAHSIFAYYTVKSGLLGLFYAIIYFFYIIFLFTKTFMSTFWEDKKNDYEFIVNIATGTTLLGAILLEPTFKTLDFSLVSTLFFANHYKQRHRHG